MRGAAGSIEILLCGGQLSSSGVGCHLKKQNDSCGTVYVSG